MGNKGWIGTKKAYRGTRVGKLVVGEYLGGAKWEAVCDCGNRTTCLTGQVTKGSKRSCGCIKPQVRHGFGGRKSRPPEYRAWQQMRGRCDTNSGYVKKHNYSERGITVCSRWADFRNFYADMGPRPSPQHSLDRIDPNGNYEPSNCRWATVEQQVNNRRNSLFVTYDGVTQTVGQWAIQLGCCRETLRLRYHRGLSPKEVLFGEEQT